MSASSHVTTPKDIRQAATALEGVAAVSYTHLTLPTN